VVPTFSGWETAIVLGGVAGPLLMLLGLARGSAAQTALLLNLESVLTALLAWCAFGEAFSRRIAVGMAAIAAGAMALAWTPGRSLALDPAAVFVVAACAAWAVDNNVTRRVSGSDPVLIAALKGLVAGPVNIGIALATGTPWPDPGFLVWAGLVGLLGYGSLDAETRTALLERARHRPCTLRPEDFVYRAAVVCGVATRPR
jgi:drug/metabolite transporter (DMT)-like permease